MPVKFPPVESANKDGLLALGGVLNAEILISAYKQGIFPWPAGENYPMTWFAPNPRGVIKFKDFKIPRSAQKALKKSPFEIRFNQDFETILLNCAHAKRKSEDGTWINQEIVQGYTELFAAERAYCVGAYDNGELVGGLYGACVGEIVSGESMFYKKTNASKAALIALVERLKSRGLEFLDTQMVTPVIASFGAQAIPREEYMDMLSKLDCDRPRSDLF